MMVRNNPIENKQMWARRISVASILFAFVSFVLVSIVFRESLVGQLFGRDTGDTFMDYFNCLPGVASRKPYANNCMYPPLAELIFYLFGKIIPYPILIKMHTPLMRMEQSAILSFLLYLSLPIFITVCSISDYLCSNSKSKYFIVLSFLVSSPFLFLVERGNVIIYSFASAMVFICNYDNPKKWRREIALIALAFSAGIKLYPAILGLVLIRDRRWKETARCIIYGLVLFFGPFFCFGGFQSFLTMIKSLLGSSGGGFVENGFNGKINFSGIFNMLGSVWFGRTEAFPWAQPVAYILSALLICAAFVTRYKWKTILFLTLVMIGLPSFSFYYTGVFVLIPFIWFISGVEKELKWTDIVYLIAFIAFLAPFPITIGSINTICDINLNIQICGVSILVMTLWGIVDTVIEMHSMIRNRKISNMLSSGEN